MNKQQEPEVYCSFCGKHNLEVTKVIQGPQVAICNECVSLCVRILLEPEMQKKVNDE